jgi:hypothetical protein
MGYISFEVEGLADLRLIRLALTQANREIPREMSKAVTTQARLLRDEARAEIVAMPTPQQAGHTGMRKEIAAGVHVNRLPLVGDATGVRIGTRMTERDEAMLPRGMDSPIKGWRHPFFGDKTRWYRQHGIYSWFMDTMEDGHDPLERRLYEVLRDARDDIAQGGRFG